jgi:hypothetical protein
MATNHKISKAILVDVEYLKLLEHLAEEIQNARLAEMEVWARNRIIAAMTVSEEIERFLAENGT